MSAHLVICLLRIRDVKRNRNEYVYREIIAIHKI